MAWTHTLKLANCIPRFSNQYQIALDYPHDGAELLKQPPKVAYGWVTLTNYPCCVTISLWKWRETIACAAEHPNAGVTTRQDVAQSYAPVGHIDSLQNNSFSLQTPGNLILCSARSELSQASLLQQSGPALISTIIEAVKGVLEVWR
jgi:hypothetical protein